MSINALHSNDVNRRVNTVTGLKKYQEVKKVMEVFKNELRQEMEKPQSTKVDYRVK